MIWGNVWDFKIKVLADPKNLTFLTTDSAQNEYYDIRVQIANGKVIPNGGKGYTTGSIRWTAYIWKQCLQTIRRILMSSAVWQDPAGRRTIIININSI